MVVELLDKEELESGSTFIRRYHSLLVPCHFGVWAGYSYISYRVKVGCLSMALARERWRGWDFYHLYLVNECKNIEPNILEDWSKSRVYTCFLDYV